VTSEDQTPSTHQSKRGNAEVVPIPLPNEVVQAASRFWRLFPVFSRSRFVTAETRIEDATSDLNQLEQWAVEQPGCNWGLATGQASGVFVLEIHAALGANALRGLCDGDWDEETGLQSQAGEVGYAFFRWPKGMAMRRSAKNLARGLSIRGEGDYVLVPPSACPARTSHVYINPDAEIATSPQWLLNSAFSVESAGKTLAFRQSAQHLAPFAANSAKSSGGKLLSFPSRTSNIQRYRIYMSFEHRAGAWHCKFLDRDLLTILPRVLKLATAKGVFDAAERGGGVTDVESRKALERALKAGRGGVFLSLSKDQYELLQAG
jgi:hypothetical protein